MLTFPEPVFTFPKGPLFTSAGGLRTQVLVQKRQFDFCRKSIDTKNYSVYYECYLNVVNLKKTTFLKTPEAGVDGNGQLVLTQAERSTPATECHTYRYSCSSHLVTECPLCGGCYSRLLL